MDANGDALTYSWEQNNTMGSFKLEPAVWPVQPSQLAPTDFFVLLHLPQDISQTGKPPQEHWCSAR